MFRRALLLMTMSAVTAALAATPALAGEDPDPTPPAPQQTPTQPAPAPAPAPTPTPTQPAPVLHGSAKLRTSQCGPSNRSQAVVSGSRIESVTFFVDGKKVKSVTSPDSSGRFSLTMGCSNLSAGTHRGRASVTFQSGVRPTHRTMVFQVTRTQQARPQFTG
jgi:hypothetical protein